MRGGLVAGTAVAAMLVAAAPAAAKTFEVTRHNDPAPGQCKPKDCSLREAIRAANARSGRDVVILPDRRPRYNLRRPNSAPLVDEDGSLEGDLDVTDPLTIRHPGRGRATVDGNAIDRVLEIQARTTIKRVTITGGGNVSQEAPRTGRRTSLAGSGGGIESHHAVTLIRSAVVANTGAEAGGGINVEPSFEPGAPAASLRLMRSVVARNRTIQGLGGGIDTFDSRATVVRSRIVGNRSDNAGGGMQVGEGSFLRMSRSTVAGNRGGAGVGGVYIYESSGRIVASTISGNTTAPNSSTGGIELSSFTSPSTLSIVNSTIAGNRAALGPGGVRASGPTAVVNLRNVTVVRNDGDSDDNGGVGGGLAQELDASMTVVNSLIALNTDQDGRSDCVGSFDSDHGNVLSAIPLLCEGFGPGSGDFIRANPKLGPLKRNGGPTKTVALKRGSPAIGKAVRSEAPNRDQRGAKRDGKPDIGAYERKRRRR